MKKTLIPYIVALSILIPSGKYLYATSEAGAVFLIIYPGARPNGMGAVFTSISDDAIATYYNDAGMAFQTKNDVSLMHANWLPGLYPGMYYEFFSAVHPVRNGVLGGNLIYLTTGNTEGTDENGNKIGEWTTWDASVKISYATKLSKNLGIGIGAKFIYSFLAPVDIIQQLYGRSIRYGGSGNSWAFDVSSFYKINSKTRTGISIQNIGPDIKYIEAGVGDPLPLTLRLGLSREIFNNKDGNALLISGELTKILVGFDSELDSIQIDSKGGFTYLYRDTWKGIGVEYTLGGVFTLRTGYFADAIGKRQGFTFGGGIKLKKFRFDLGIDSRLYEFPTDNYRLSLHFAY
ncbi:MAG: PorV/PorQ family protein [bacterium]|nr:PorV/PorQ family protein [bacterium]